MSSVWEVAKKMEKDGEAYYEKLAKQAPVRELAGAFHQLAQEEVKHFEFFSRLEKELPAGTYPQSEVGAKIKQLFENLKVPDKAMGAGDAEASYMQAMVLEKKSVEFYEDALRQATTADQKNALKAIIEEEKRHEKIVAALLEFVRRPKQWLEDNEFVHLDEY